MPSPRSRATSATPSSSVASSARTGSAPATTRTNSPRGASARYRSSAAPSVVRHTSSCSFVSSRQTATGRAAPRTSARSARVGTSLCGASWRTIVRRSPASSARWARRFFLFMGRKPSKVKRPVSSPDSASAVTKAHGPGTAVTVTPASAHRRTRSSPGSLIAGIPASVTSAPSSPASRRWTSSGPRPSSLCRW